MSAQIVLLRQLIVIFYGNEISLGFLLGAWMFWGALGGLLGKFADRIKNYRVVFAVLEIVLAVALVFVILLMRRMSVILDILPGEIIGFLPMLIFSFLSVAPICIILGFLFALASRAFSENQDASLSITRVYIKESVGAVCGGLLVSLCLIRFFDGFYIMLALAVVNISCAAMLIFRLRKPKFIWLFKAFSVSLLILILAAVVSQKAKFYHLQSLKNQWKGFSVLDTRDSIYGNLVLTQEQEQYSFFNNGLYLFSVPDEARAEEAVHFALLETHDPKEVLLIGAGIGGLAAEILKYSISRLDYVELDPELIDLARDNLPQDKLSFLNDQRLNLIHQDGRLFIKQRNTKGTLAAYDTIITYLGDPYNAQINRFYTQEFFREVKRALSDKGVFSFAIGASENFLSREQKQLLSSIHKSLSSVFSDVKMIPGDTVYFLAANQKDILTYDYNVLLRRLKQRGIKTRFVREYYLFSKMSKERINYLEESIASAGEAKLNRDFHPISYYYDMVLWSTYFVRPWRNFFASLSGSIIWGCLVFVYLAIIIFSLLARKRNTRNSPFVLLAVATTGIAELSFQVVILLAFQIIYGHLYYKLGLILSAFMVGLVWGSLVIKPRLQRIKDDYSVFIKTQLAIALYPLILPVVFFMLSATSGIRVLSWLGSNLIFPLLPVVAGFVGGFQFPLANKILLQDRRAVGETSGRSYGFDLAGACLGAVLISAFFVPIIGLNQSCVAIAILNGVVLLAILITRRR